MGPAASAAFSLHLDLAAAEAVDAMTAEGAPVVALKGPSIALWLYPDGGRRYGDVDLLVPLPQLPAARRVLTRLGYACNYSPLTPGAAGPTHVDHHAEYWRRGNAHVDLHWRIPGTTVSSERIWDVLAPHIEPMVIGSRTLPVLSEPARALHVVLHCAQHSDAGQPQRDVERLVDVLPDERWAEVVALADRLGARGALVLGLERTPAGRGVASRHEIRGRPDDLHVALNALGAPPAAAALDRVAAALRGTATPRDVWGVLFPPAAMMREKQRLARRGRSGLALAYVARLGDRFLRLPSAWVALRRARRLLRDDA